MREHWTTDDVRLIFGKAHPLVRRLEGRDIFGNYEGRTYDSPSHVWHLEELARILLVLWRRHPERRPALSEAALALGCEDYMVKLARKMAIPALPEVP